MELNLEKYRHIPHGDMPGDKICIEESHVNKAGRILPVLEEEIEKEKMNGKEKVVVTVCGEFRSRKIGDCIAACSYAE